MVTFTSEFEDVLKVLAITVIVDQQVRNPEILESNRQAAGLANLCGIVGYCPDDGLEWYRRNQVSINEELQGRSRNTVILKSLTAIKDEAIREALYDAMVAVSISDEEYHKKESDFVRSAATIWGFVRPPFKVVDN